MTELEKPSFCYPRVILKSGKAHQKMLKSLGKMLFMNKRAIQDQRTIPRLPTNYKVGWDIPLPQRNVQSPPYPMRPSSVVRCRCESIKTDATPPLEYSCPNY